MLEDARGFMMTDKITIFHGSKNIIERPILGYGNAKNDYGLAFYCTQSIELAKEWACQENQDGFANKYELDIEGLSLLDLDAGEYHILNWLAILLQNRTFRLNSDLTQRSADYISEHYLPEYESYDVIVGYRADDSYFSFANAFLNNSISLERLEEVMYLGNLGEQVAIKSQMAFDNLTFLEARRVDSLEYYPKRLKRDQDARDSFFAKRFSENGTYMIDIMRQQWRDDDERLQRIVFR